VTASEHGSADTPAGPADSEGERRRAAGLSYAQAGELAGVSARTARRRVSDPPFATELASRRAARVSDVTGRLLVGADRAVQVLLEALESPVTGERLRAADLVLSMSRRFRADCDVDRRLSSLEAAAAPTAGAARGGTG